MITKKAAQPLYTCFGKAQVRPCAVGGKPCPSEASKGRVVAPANTGKYPADLAEMGNRRQWYRAEAPKAHYFRRPVEQTRGFEFQLPATI